MSHWPPQSEEEIEERRKQAEWQDYLDSIPDAAERNRAIVITTGLLADLRSTKHEAAWGPDRLTEETVSHHWVGRL